MAMRAYRFFRTSLKRKPPVEPTEEEDKRQHKLKEKCRHFGKKLLMFMFSHIGLTGLVVGYSILGGVIFMELESGNEEREKVAVGNMRHEFVHRLWDATSELNVLFKPNWTILADKIFKDFQREVYIAVKEKGWDGTEGGRTTSRYPQWTYAGALLYSVTIITTIGYGHIAPRTAWGRVVTIVYALIGIPITLLCLANIGGVLGKCFRFVYGRIICGLCRMRRRQKHQAVRVATNKSRKKRCECCGCCTCCKREELESDNGAVQPVDVTVELESPLDYYEDDIIRVPVIVTLGIMAGYVFGGAMLFTLWEDDWDYLVGAYFCFITLSTIGFGDFVPGTSMSSWDSQEKIILCSLYLLFGLAILAMCFDLMQEQVRYNCKRVGRWLGIIEDQRT